MLLPPTIVVALAALGLSSTPFASAAPAKRGTAITATVKNGTYTGLNLPTFDQEVFYGVPYAQPPVGNLRLRQSLPLNSSFSGTKALTTRVPQCAGVGSDDWGYELSEDCLYMNVLRPAGVAEGDNLPVGLWIHGGGYTEGGINDDRYNGSWMVQRSVEMGKPILHVAIAYRLNAFGFLNSNQSIEEGVQNLGLHDQRRALLYVQENIKAFGGDPEKVTIWGESAGAMSVSAHLLANGETSTDLFRGAIMESGSPTTEGWSAYSVASTAATFDQILTNLSCADVKDQLQCLREVPYLTFNETTSSTTWMPTIDGTLVPESPTQQLKAGKYVPVPILLGANTDEGTAFGARGINSDADLVASLSSTYPALSNASIAKILSLYPDDNTLGAPFGTGDGYLSTGRQDKRSCAIGGDITMVGPRRHLAETVSEKQAKVFSYRFDQPPTYYGLTAGLIDLGVTHFQEVSYVYGNHPYNNRTGDPELAKYMVSAWISFIHDQTPNNHGIKGEPTWPEYATNATNMVFKRQGRKVEKDSFRKEGIAYLASIGEELGK